MPKSNKKKNIGNCPTKKIRKSFCKNKSGRFSDRIYFFRYVRKISEI